MRSANARPLSIEASYWPFKTPKHLKTCSGAVLGVRGFLCERTSWSRRPNPPKTRKKCLPGPCVPSQALPGPPRPSQVVLWVKQIFHIFRIFMFFSFFLVSGSRIRKIKLNLQVLRTPDYYSGSKQARSGSSSRPGQANFFIFQDFHVFLHFLWFQAIKFIKSNKNYRFFRTPDCYSGSPKFNHNQRKFEGGTMCF